MRVDTNLCWRCGEPDSPYHYGPLMHPGTYECERCLVEQRVDHIYDELGLLPSLEMRLEKLGGPAKQIFCGYITWMGTGDPSKFEDYCWLEQYHKGNHSTERKS